MVIKVYKPTTPGRRGMTSVTEFGISKKIKPLKKLTKGRKESAGRSKGRISIWHRGGGHKRKLRLVDFKQDKLDIEGKVVRIEYDPGRSAYLAQIVYTDGEKRYVLAWQGIKIGEKILTSKNKIEIKPGNRMPLSYLQSGTFIHNIALTKEGSGKIVRGAGTAATLMGIENKMVQIKLPSSEIRLVSEEAMATIGEISKKEHKIINIGKAGRQRWMGIRPTVRGKAMSVDSHPHGGGEGRNPIGLKYPKTPWGKHALGVKTRKRHKPSSKFIIKRRG